MKTAEEMRTSLYGVTERFAEPAALGEIRERLSGKPITICIKKTVGRKVQLKTIQGNVERLSDGVDGTFIFIGTKSDIAPMKMKHLEKLVNTGKAVYRYNNKKSVKYVYEEYGKKIKPVTMEIKFELV